MWLLLLPPLPTTLAGWPAYSLFYLLGFGLAGALLLAEGWRRSFPLRPWLLLVAGTVLALIAGTRLIAGSAADWQALLHHGYWGTGVPLGRSVLGGMVAALLALAGLRRLLGFGRAAADAFALPFVLALAVQGVGCLLVGCCFGQPLEPGFGFGLGLTYGPASEAFGAQVARGLLSSTAAHSLPVHAAQLYQVFWLLLVAAALLAGRRGLARRPGLALPLAFGLYTAGRFGLEFFRDPLGDVVGAGIWFGLKPVQWGLLGATALLAALAARRARYPAANNPLSTAPDQPLLNLLLVLLLLPPVLLPGSFTLAETLVLRALLLPVLVLEGVRLLRMLRLAQPLPVALLLLSGGLMSQTPADTTSRATSATPSLTFGLGGLTGSSYQLYYDPSSCGTPRQNITQFPGYWQRYSGVTANATYSRPVGKSGRNTLNYSLNGFVGQTSFTPGEAFNLQSNGPDPLAAELPASRALYDINPSVEFFAPGGPDHKTHWRLGMGLHLSNRYAYDSPTQPLRNAGVVPAVVLEYGRNWLWLHSSVLHEAYAVGNGAWRMGLGTGFGHDRVTLLGGVATMNSNGQNTGNWDFLGGTDYSAPTPVFAELRWQASPSWLVEGSALSNFNDVSRLSLGARYRLALPTQRK